jgi:protein TonB
MRFEAILFGAALVAGCGPRPPLAGDSAESGDREAAGEAAESETVPVFDEAPRPIAMVRPEYPDAARQEDLEGVVVLRVTIAPDGTVSDVSVVSSDEAVFNEPAVTAVRQWKWQPATQEGKPVSSTVSIPLSFSLD